jgi:hypothetical protein
LCQRVIWITGAFAALQAAALRDCLARRDHDPARRFFQAAAKPVGTASKLAAAANLALPQSKDHGHCRCGSSTPTSTGTKQDPNTDIVLTEQFFRVAGLAAPQPSREDHDDVAGPPISEP